MSTYARELNGGAMKVIPVYPGTFLELIFLKAVSPYTVNQTSVA